MVRQITGILALLLTFFLIVSPALAAGNISSTDKYAWSENTGWMNFEPTLGDGLQVANDKLTGYAWAENIGWVNLSCENNGSCGTVSYGVVNDGSGNLSYGCIANRNLLTLASDTFLQRT